MKKNALGRAVYHSPIMRLTVRIMKITTLLLLIGCLQVSAGVYSQTRITLKLDGVEMKKALSAIERKSSYRFLYNQALMGTQSLVDVSANNEEVVNVLNRLLENTALTYELLDNYLVVLKTRGAESVLAVITGTVTDEKGQPLPGATVKVKGSSTGTSTDANGKFSLNVPDDAVLEITYVGYETAEVPVAGKTDLSISLKPSSQLQDQVVVVGYGTQRKLDVTGAVTQLKGDELAKQPAINPVSSLQGKVAGVQITNRGAPGSSPQIRIRGLGTVYGDPNPLYVVDGVWFTDISFLNPNDIESLSILKDASAQSIYGIRAANGVVLITTKKGRSGKPVINYNGYVGWSKITNQIDLANGNEFATMANELLQINTKNPDTSLVDASQFGKGTEWYNQILRNALITSHQISVSGGADRTTYSFSLGYLRQDGLVETNKFERFTAKLQTDFTVTKDLKVGYTVTASANQTDSVPESIFRELYTAAPIVPVYYSDGSYGDPSDFNLGDGANFNPQVTIDYNDQKSKFSRVTGSMYAELKFLKNFTFRTSLGGEYGQYEFQGYTPVYAATLKQRNTTSRLNVGRTEIRNWIIENTLTYDRKFGDHSVKALVGQGAQRNQWYRLTASALNVPNTSDGDRYLTLGDPATRFIDDDGDLYTVASYFGRVNYAFKSRYLVNASIRADGSSKFFGDDRWAYLPSVGVGWVITEESFMDDQEIFNNLKLRGSWGKIGNASVPTNISVLRVNQDPYLTAIFNGQLFTGASITTVVPPTTVWEKGVGTDIGIEASLLKSRLSVEVDWYNRETEDAIFPIPILSSVGTTGAQILGNQATFRNRGWEFTVNWRDGIGKDVSYTVGANLSINDNEVTSTITGKNPIFAGGGASTGGALATRTVVGRPIGEFYGYQTDGIFQNQAEIDNSAQPTAAPGDFRFKDLSGPQGKPDGVIDALDRVPIGNPNPKYYYGINTTWNYKNWDLQLDFQGVAGVDIYNANLAIRYGNENFTKEFYDNRWHGEGTSNKWPSANIGGGENYRPNSFFVESGAYFRVRNAQLGYTINPDVTGRWKISRIRVYANAQNPFNFFSYRGINPELGGTPIDAGIDNNVYPLFATYNFGLNVTF